MALYRLICALGHQSSVTVLTRCELPLPVSHSSCVGTRRITLKARFLIPRV
jgi:hypothetical protein